MPGVHESASCVFSVPVVVSLSESEDDLLPCEVSRIGCEHRLDGYAIDRVESGQLEAKAAQLARSSATQMDLIKAIRY
jgi:hypothetical protein